MGAALKKDQDYTALSYLSWAAWGIIEIEKLERMQRRNYINHVRQELALHGMELECAGSSMNPLYVIRTIERHPSAVNPATSKKPLWVSSLTREQQRQAFKHVCFQALIRINPDFAKIEAHN